ncbi:hypothetical protein PQX77_016747 [Marasmius sp. AFHP31]|nr:hypothetical protein PQX77_016747 [Marasmius sp. AFHP31]
MDRRPQQQYSPQPPRPHTQARSQGYQVSAQFRPLSLPELQHTAPTFAGRFPPLGAPLPALPPPASFPVPLQNQNLRLPSESNGHGVPNSYSSAGNPASYPTPTGVFHLGGPRGSFGYTQPPPLAPSALRPQAPSPMRYAGHVDTSRSSSNFNARPPFSDSPFSNPPKPDSFLWTSKLRPSRPVQAPVTWDSPVVHHNIDARSLHDAPRPPPTLPIPNNPPAHSPCSFRPPSMSIPASATSQSFCDIRIRVHRDDSGAASPPGEITSSPTLSFQLHSSPSCSCPLSSLTFHSPLEATPPSSSLSITCPPSLLPPSLSQSLPPVEKPPFSPSQQSSPPSPSPVVSHPPTSLARLMNPLSTSPQLGGDNQGVPLDTRVHEGTQDDEPENPAVQDAGSNWALAEQPSSAVASKPSLGEGERQLKARTTNHKIADACNELLNKHNAEWLDLANKNGWPMERLRRAGLFHLTKKLNGELPTGRKLKLVDLHQRLKANEKVMQEVNKGAKSKKVQKWTKELKAHRATKIVGTRGSSNRIRKAGTNGYKALKDVADTLSANTGAITFGFVARSEFGTPVTAGLYGSGNMEDFLQETYNVSAFDFLLSAEAYSCLAHLKK